MDEPARTAPWAPPVALALGVVAAIAALAVEPSAATLGGLAVLLPVAARARTRRAPPPPPPEPAPDPASPLPAEHRAGFEALGMLAGGIAHDFNNLLTGILGNTNLALKCLSRGEARDAVIEAEAAARQARELVAQILAFSGRGGLERRPLDLVALVAGTAHLLQRVVSPRTRLVLDTGVDPLVVDADPAQLRQVVMNLITNASEALGGRPGEVRVRVAQDRLDRAALDAARGGAGLPEGDYVRIEVADDGCGMDEEVRARMFDPCFTTKSTGRGLGLAAIEAVLRYHRGAVRVDSAPGQGTTLRLWLPRSADPLTDTPHLLTPPAPDRHGTVLLAEDEDIVRRVTTRMLSKLGYQVVAVRDGEEALKFVDDERQELVLALVDFMMPRLDGSRVLQQLRRRRPRLPVVIMTGYAGAEGDRSGDQPDAWLRKPFSIGELHEALEASRRAELLRTEPLAVRRTGPGPSRSAS